MKGVRVLLLATCLIVFAKANAQEHPWEKYGYKPKIVTLSNGKYQEFHDLDTIVEIGSALFDRKNGKIIGIVEYDTLYSEADMKPYIISRWISPDPKSEEYSSWSPYNYCMNNPIIFIDPNGEDVVIVIGGIDPSNDGDTGTGKHIAGELNTWASENNIQDFSAKDFAADKWDNVKGDIMSYISDNYDASSGEKLIITGYSWGGDTSVEVAEMLKEQGINVDLLITVDAAKGPLSSDLGDWVDREIPDNVNEATNYYQDKPSKVRSHGDEATAADPSKTSVMNIKVTTEGTTHSNIDEHTKPLVIDEIKAKVERRYEKQK